MKLGKTRKKNESEWILVKHGKVNFKEVKKAMENLPKEAVWLKQESMIIHICCRDIDAAKSMLKICQQSGLKRAGIVTIGKRVMIEAFGTDRMDTIVALKGRVLVDDDYIKILIREANKRHDKNIEKIERLYKKIKEIKEINP